MTLEHLMLSVELQGNITIKVYDYDKEEYTASIDHYDPNVNLFEEYGDYYVKFIYDGTDGDVVIEIAKE